MLDDKTIAYVIAGGAWIAALGQIFGGRTLVRYAVSRGVLNAGQTIKFTALILIVIGVLCVLPDFSIYGVRALAGYAIISSFILHKFWDESDRDIRLHETMHFLKNIFIAAILIVISI